VRCEEDLDVVDSGRPVRERRALHHQSCWVGTLGDLHDDARLGHRQSGELLGDCLAEPLRGCGALP
jgi:hypothetical protein